jgi:hypothetical protein
LKKLNVHSITNDTFSISVRSYDEIVDPMSFFGCRSLLSVTFESDSHLRRIEESPLRNCSCLPSIWLTSSVEILGECCLAGCGIPPNVAFDRESKLSRIEKCAFSGCSLLCSIVLSTGVVELCELGFGESPFNKRLSEPGNLHFALDSVLVDFDDTSLIRCYGLAYEVAAPKWITRFNGGSLRECHEIGFETGISRIPKPALLDCPSV